jgi:hypothetical protein
MAKTVKVWVSVNTNDGSLGRVAYNKPSCQPADGAIWVEMIGELPGLEPFPLPLLPCPFCGGKARLIEDVPGRVVVCSNRQVCNVRGPTRDNGIEAAVAWNRRVGAQ